MSAAWHLARYGYKVDVYEKDEDIGGKLTHNIPDDRLSPGDVSRDLERIRSLGIKFITGSVVDKKLFSELKDRYSAVIIAAGAQRPRTLGFPGEDQAVSSFQFLRTSKMGEKSGTSKANQLLFSGPGMLLWMPHVNATGFRRTA